MLVNLMLILHAKSGKVVFWRVHSSPLAHLMSGVFEFGASCYGLGVGTL